MLKQDRVCGWCKKTDELALYRGQSVRTVCIECGSAGPSMPADDIWKEYKALRVRLAKVEAQRDGLKAVLIFIDEECDWEEPKGDFGGGGDPRIGPAIREALAKLEEI